MSTEDEQMEVRPFAAVLQEIGGGKFAARLATQLAEVTAAVAATGKKGKVTLTIEVAQLKKADAGTLTVTGTSAYKAPEGDDAAPTSVFFADDHGNLRRDDPRQQQLPLVGLPTRKDVTA